MRIFSWTGGARLLRFATTGGAAALVQLVILDTLVERHWAPLPADIVAVVLSTQVNFVLSYIFTWGDRRPLHSSRSLVLTRWARYQGSVAGTAALSLIIFTILHPHIGPTGASAVGALLGGVINFVAGDHLVFRRPTVAPQSVIPPGLHEPMN